MEAAPRAAVQLPPTQSRLSRALSLQKLVSYKIWQLPEAELPHLLQSLEITHIAISPCSVTVIPRELSLLPSTCELHKKEQGIEGSQAVFLLTPGRQIWIAHNPGKPFFKIPELPTRELFLINNLTPLLCQKILAWNVLLLQFNLIVHFNS